jgi:uncharacterized protein (DUF1330 family)
MAAYVISEVDVRDAAAIEIYRTLAAESIAQYGGRYLVRNGAASIAEGGPAVKNIVVVEFPSMVKLRSPESAADSARPPTDFRRRRAGLTN